MPFAAAVKEKRPNQKPTVERTQSRPRPRPDHEEIPEIAQIILQSVAEMLTSGGDSREVNLLIHAAVAHRTRTMSGPHADDEVVSKIVKTDYTKNLESWRSDLIQEWKRAEYLDRHDADCEFVRMRDRLRNHAESRLRTQLEDFIERANPEEIRLLSNILVYWDSIAPSLPVYGQYDLPLAEAFEKELGNQHVYLRLKSDVWRESLRSVAGFNEGSAD